MNITEHPIDEKILGGIEGCAGDAARILGMDINAPEEELVRAVDDFVYQWQKGQRPEVDDGDDLSLIMGSLWGQQVVRKLGWQWAGVTFHDHGDLRAVGVFSPDRSLAVYPFYFIDGCMENNASVTIMLSYNMLVEGNGIPSLPPRGYENVMDCVHHTIPRD